MPGGQGDDLQPRPPRLQRVLYAFSSAGNNNGSAFAGLGANTPFYNTALGLAMLFARYWLAIPTLAIAGSLARKKIVPAGAGHAADPHAALRRAARRRGRARRRADVHPGPRAGADRRAPHDDRPSQVKRGTDHANPREVAAPLRGSILWRAVVDSFRKLTPGVQVRNPVMFVVYVGSILTTGLFIQALVGKGEAPAGFIFWRRACGSGSRCCSPTSPRRWPKGAARPRPKPCAERAATSRPRSSQKPERNAGVTTVSASALRKGDVVLVEAGDFDPRRRRGRRGRRLGRRERDHRRERARHPRERRRPERRHRRHARPVGLAHRADQRQPRRDIPRPHDRHGRGRQAPEDAERDRAQHPAGRRSPSSSCWRPRPCCRTPSTAWRRGPGHARDRDRAGRAPRVPHPDDHRRAPVGDRDRGHGPDDPGERHRHVRPRGRGGGRRGRAAARQDGHDHPRQPPGHGVRPDRRASPSATSPTRPSSRRWPTRRPEGRSIVVLAKEKYGIRERDVQELGATFVPFTAQTRMSGVNLERPPGPQGRRRRHRGARPGTAAGASPRRCAAARRRRRRSGAPRRSSWPTARGCSA